VVQGLLALQHQLLHKLLHLADPTYAAIALIATVQVAASVIVTAILTPILTTLVLERNNKKKSKASLDDENLKM